MEATEMSEQALQSWVMLASLLSVSYGCCFDGATILERSVATAARCFGAHYGWRCWKGLRCAIPEGYGESLLNPSSVWPKERPEVLACGPHDLGAGSLGTSVSTLSLSKGDMVVRDVDEVTRNQSYFGSWAPVPDQAR